MTILKTLKLAAATPSDIAGSEGGIRLKLLRYLQEQKALAEATIAGTPFHATRLVARTNEAGERARVEVARHVRKGWFNDATGKLFFQLRYGSKPLDLSKGMNAVEVTAMADLPNLIERLVMATNAGELDAQLKAAIAQRKANFKPRVKAI